MTRTFVRLAACIDERDVEEATGHPAVTAVSVDRGPEALCRPCVELDPGVSAMLLAFYADLIGTDVKDIDGAPLGLSAWQYDNVIAFVKSELSRAGGERRQVKVGDEVWYCPFRTMGERESGRWAKVLKLGQYEFRIDDGREPLRRGDDGGTWLRHDSFGVTWWWDEPSAGGELADEIEQLRREVKVLRPCLSGTQEALEERGREVERVTQERDEARRHLAAVEADRNVWKEDHARVGRLLVQTEGSLSALAVDLEAKERQLAAIEAARAKAMEGCADNFSEARTALEHAAKMSDQYRDAVPVLAELDRRATMLARRQEVIVALQSELAALRADLAHNRECAAEGGKLALESAQGLQREVEELRELAEASDGLIMDNDLSGASGVARFAVALTAANRVLADLDRNRGAR